MTPVFADSAYWIAVNTPDDDLYTKAVAWARGIGSRPVTTSEMVLTELLDGAAERGPLARREASRFVRFLYLEPTITVVPMSAELFDAALTLYEQRPDKQWSLTDCASLWICQKEEIYDVLTYDHHFEQMGLNPLLRGNP